MSLETPVAPLTTLHVSSLSSYLRCGIAYERRTINREGRPPTTPQIRGSAVHRGVGAGMLLQKESGTATPPELMEDVTAAEVDRARHGGATFTRDEASAGARATWGLLKDRAVRFASGYARLVAPTVQPVAVEHRVTVADVIPGVLLRGTIDLVDAAGDGQSSETIRDTKTTERIPSQDAADRSQQLSMYDLLRSAESPNGAGQGRRVSLDYLVLKAATGEVTHQRLDSWRSQRDRAGIVARFENALRGMRAGIFLPANPETDWWCSARWCEFHDTCPFAIRGR